MQSGNGCRHNLHHEFELGAERQHIIENAECDNDGRSEQDAQHGLIELPENQNRTQEAAVNGQTAQPRDRLFVHAACILRHVDRADLVCKVLDRRCEKIAQHGSYGKRAMIVPITIYSDMVYSLLAQRATKPTFR